MISFDIQCDLSDAFVYWSAYIYMSVCTCDLGCSYIYIYMNTPIILHVNMIGLHPDDWIEAQ